MIKSFWCECGNEIEVDVPEFWKADIFLTCYSCGFQWTENPYEDYCDSQNDADREAV